MSVLKKMTPIILLSLLLPVISLGQTTSLQKCLTIASKNNLSLKQARSALSSSKYNLEAEKKSYLPKVDLLSSYTYLSNPLKVNLQTVRNGIVEGTSKQNLNAVNEVFKELTGKDLSQAAQDRIFNTSQQIIGAIYPDYNPNLSNQSYFLAGIGARQPIFLGRKLDASANLAESLVNSADINVDVVNKEIGFLIAAEYLRILYLNTIFGKQQLMVDALTRNNTYAQELVNKQILAPYQKSWTRVILTQAETQLNNIKLEQQNAFIELNKLMGVSLDSTIIITDTLNYVAIEPSIPQKEFWNANPLYRLAGSKISYAKTAEKISKSFSLPNIFAIGNYNLYQRDLPILTPDWFVGVELQWNLFNGQKRKRTLAAQQLIDESKLGEENARLGLQVVSKVARNKMRSLQNEVASLDYARKEAHITSRLINERMKNQLSSPKDVNDALVIETEVEKGYYTAVFGYLLAAAEYFNSLGNPQQITQYLK